MPFIDRTLVGPAHAFVQVSLLVLILALSAPVAGAQVKGADFDPDPLRPADTSSPRDTLQGFLENFKVVIEEFRAGGLRASGFRAFRRALETLDFRNTPNGDSWQVRTFRSLMLQELLDRIELPPDNEIPGDREVSEGAIKRWTIPETRITIAQIQDGPRAGDFLFSASTVGQIDSLYRTAKHLPYKAGATGTPYERLVEIDLRNLDPQVQRRLKPVDTSSPRATLDGFLHSVNRSYALIMKAETGLKATPPTLTTEEARELEIQADNLLQRAMTTLDLSRVPEALRQDVGIETVLQLKEILDRLVPPPLESIPNAKMVTAARKGGIGSFSRDTGPLRWRFPDTQIEIAEIMEGDRQGQFLFSARTVGRIADDYRKIRDLAYRPASFGGTEREYVSPGLSPGFYENYISSPGYLVPGAHFLGGLVEDLPGPLKKLYGGQTGWQWIGLVLCLLVVVLVGYLVFRVINRLAGRRGWLKILAPIVVAIVVVAVFNFIDEGVNITGGLLSTVTAGGKAIVIVMVAWAIFALCVAVAETVIALPKIHGKGIDASLLRLGARILGFAIGAWIVIDGIQGLGADVLPLLAGLGIGGLAVALAAQSTIANFIGSLILFTNRPVRVGDFCQYGDHVGTVEEIGLHSTRIRSLERTVVTVPNAEFSQMKLDNFQRRDRRLLKVVLGLRYETTPEQMRYVLARLRALLLEHPKVIDPARVRLVGYGAYSKDLEVFTYLRCRDQDTFLAIQEDILLRMEEIVNEAGTGFAFPSQTAYLSRDTGLDAGRRGEAEAQVEQWRVAGKLPFPEFENEERERLKDTLDYPPKGSPDYEPPAGSSEPPPGPTARPTDEPKDAAQGRRSGGKGS